MYTTSFAAPATIGASSAVATVFYADPRNAVLRAGAGLGPGDTFAVYGILTSSPGANARLLGTISGSNGVSAGNTAITLGNYPFIFVTRLGGGGSGNLFVSGATLDAGTTWYATASISTTPGAVSSLLPLFGFGGEILVSLGSAFTSNDVVNVYGTNDPTATNGSGTVFVGTLQGGGDITASWMRVNGKGQETYTYLVFQRVSGTTTGSAAAVGISSAGQNNSGAIVTTNAVPQAIVDENVLIFVNVASGAVTVPAPTAGAGTRLVTNAGSGSFTLYGMTVQAASASPQHSTAEIVWDSISSTWTLVGNT